MIPVHAVAPGISGPVSLVAARAALVPRAEGPGR